MREGVGTLPGAFSASGPLRTLEGMRTPEQIAKDVKRERVREAVDVERREHGAVRPGRVQRRVRLPREEVVEFLGELADAMDEQLDEVAA